MMKILVAGAVALAMTAGVAMAQTTTSQSSQSSTTTVAPPAPPPPIVAPPTGTLSTSETQKTVMPDGTQTDKSQTTYRNTNGVANDTMTKTTTYAPPPVETTNTKSSTTTTTQ